MPEITFIVPAFNESRHILPVVNNLLHLTYRYKKIILVNDGSTDNTMELLIQAYQLIPIVKFYHDSLPSKPIRNVFQSTLYPELMVIDKENGERHDALNAGVNACKDPYFFVVDADTYIDDEGFESLIRPILTSPETIAIGAGVRIRNGCDLEYNKIRTNRFPISYLTAMQAIEYLRTFMMREGWNNLGGNFCIAGAFSIFVTDLIREVGGYAPTFANDLEIIVRLNRFMKQTKIPYKISYLPDPVAWTEGPSTLKKLGNQRMVWQRGTMESVWFHKSMLFNPKYGKYGFIVFPFLVFGEMLEAVVEFLALLYIFVGIYLGVINANQAAFLLLIVLTFVFLYTLFCILIEELSFHKYPNPRSIFLLVFYSFIEVFGYRQLTVFWRIRGCIGFFKRFSAIKKDSAQVNELLKKALKKRGIT